MLALTPQTAGTPQTLLLLAIVGLSRDQHKPLVILGGKKETIPKTVWLLENPSDENCEDVGCDEYPISGGVVLMKGEIDLMSDYGYPKRIIWNFSSF